MTSPFARAFVKNAPAGVTLGSMGIICSESDLGHEHTGLTDNSLRHVNRMGCTPALQLTQSTMRHLEHMSAHMMHPSRKAPNADSCL